jgi:hypothetical protein
MNAIEPILKAGTDQILIDIGQRQFDCMAKGESFHDIVLPYWIHLIEALLRMRTGERWRVDEKYQDGISFQFAYQLNGVKCESICWSLTRIIIRFDSVSQFIWEMTEWPIKKAILESEMDGE